MAKKRLHKASRVMPREEQDSVVRSRVMGRDRAFDVLWEAQQYWLAMERFRRDRERNKNYTYGKQWDDWISVDGQLVKEEDYIKSQGNVALKNNLIRRMVQAVLGVYRSQSKEPTCTARDRDEQKYGETMSTVLQCNMQLNRMSEINARCMEEFLISGFVVQRKWFGWRNDKLDCWTDYVQPNNFFIDNNMRDFRGWDVSCVGEVHDISFEELCGRFAHEGDDYARLAEIYSQARDRRVLGATFDSFGYPLQGYYDFLVPYDTTRCRVIEVWRKESKPRYRCHDVNNGDVFKIEIEDYEEFVGRVNRERLQDALELSKRFAADPRSAQFLVDMHKGVDPVLGLVRNFGIEIKDVLDDPEMQEKIAEANREYVERVAKSRQLDEEYDRNMGVTLDTLCQYQEERGMSDEQIDDVMEFLLGVVGDGVVGKFSAKTLDMACKALNYDADVAMAGEEGYRDK